MSAHDENITRLIDAQHRLIVEQSITIQRLRERLDDLERRTKPLMKRVYEA